MLLEYLILQQENYLRIKHPKGLNLQEAKLHLLYLVVQGQEILVKVVEHQQLHLVLQHQELHLVLHLVLDKVLQQSANLLQQFHLTPISIVVATPKSGVRAVMRQFDLAMIMY